MTTNYLKEKFVTSVDALLNKAKTTIIKDILISKLTVLYENKIDGQEIEETHKFFSNLTDLVNDILNQHKETCLVAIEQILNETNATIATLNASKSENSKGRS